MFRQKIKNFLILTLLGGLFFFFSSRTILAEVESRLFSISLNFQGFLRELLKQFIPDEENLYKEKYYQLLQELAKLKLSLKNINESQILEIKEAYLPKVVRVKVFKKDPLGYFYISNFREISEDLIVLDKNWTLVGRIIKVYKNYSLVESLNVPNLEFNVQNIDGELLGLAKTLSNGFLEVNFIDPQIKINLNDFVLTDKGFYPPGFVIGSVIKTENIKFNPKIIVKALFDPESSEFLVIKK